MEGEQAVFSISGKIFTCIRFFFFIIFCSQLSLYFFSGSLGDRLRGGGG